MTALNYFIPDSPLGILFVLGLITWFVTWCRRLNKESRTLKDVGASFETLNACIPSLRQHQAWRDQHQRQEQRLSQGQGGEQASGASGCEGLTLISGEGSGETTGVCAPSRGAVHAGTGTPVTTPDSPL